MNVNLNKKSVKQVGGSMMQPGSAQQEVDPAIQQVSQLFATAIQDGDKPEEVVIGLLQQEIDQDIIVQALMMIGYEDNDLQQLFQAVQELSQPQPATGQEVISNPQELARNESIAEEQDGLNVAVEEIEMAKSGIEIKPENKGKFTKWASARNMSVSEAYNKVMGNTDVYSPGVVKMANFAKNAAGWKKQDGGEFTSHLMYKGDEEIQVDTLSQHLKLKEMGYTSKAQTGKEISKEEQKLIDDKKQGVVANPLYFTNNAVKSKGWDLGRIGNTIIGAGKDMFAGDNDGDGFADGSFRQWNAKAENNKANKLANANYSYKPNTSNTNINATRDWLTQVLNDNGMPEIVDQLKEGSTPLINEDVTKPNILENTLDTLEGVGESIMNKVSPVIKDIEDFGTKSWGQLTDFTNDTYEGIRESIIKNKYGSELPKAVTGGDPALSFKDWVMEDSVRRSTFDAKQKYQDYLTGFKNNSTGAVNTQESIDLFAKIDQGSTTIDSFGGVEDYINRLGQSNGVQGWQDFSKLSVNGADIITDGIDPTAEDAMLNNRENIMADNLFNTYTDPSNSRGLWDVNSGLAGSEADRTTGLYMNNSNTTAKMGGALDNPFSGLKTFTEENRYQDGGGTKLTRQDIQKQIDVLNGEITVENDRLTGFQGKISNMAKGYSTAVNRDLDPVTKSNMLSEIIKNNNLNPDLFNNKVDEYGDAITGKDTISSNNYNWLESINGYGCTSYGCGILRNAGATIPTGVGDDFQIGGRDYDANDRFPMISGNSQLNSLIESNSGDIGMQLMPNGFKDLLPGDRIVSNYSTSNGDGAAHTMIFTGEYDENGSPMVMQNAGGSISNGVSIESLSNIKGYNDTSDTDSGLRVTRYTGNIQNMNERLADLQNQYDNTRPEAVPISRMETIPIHELRTKGDKGYKEVLKSKLSTYKQGGETVNVDSTLLAKLIAAGADIEIL